MSRPMVFIAALLFLLWTIGCRPSPPPGGSTVRPTSRPSTAVCKTAVFESATAKIRLAHPAAWRPRSSDDFLLLVAASDDPAAPALSLDVPSLPFHLPGMIGLGLVQNGYLDDLKKKHPDLRIEPVADRPAAGVKGRRVESTWTESGRSFTELALLLVHRDRVYILRVNGPAAERAALRRVFDDAADSIEWLE